MRTTNDLMKELKSEVSNEKALEEYLKKTSRYNGDSSETFSDFYKGILEQKGISSGDIEKRTGLEHAFCNKMINGKVSVTRNNLLALTIAAELRIDEVEKCLMLTNNGALNPKDNRDAIIIFSINRGLSLAETNRLLYSKNMELLGQMKE